jgi:hypothetical protein
MKIKLRLPTGFLVLTGQAENVCPGSSPAGSHLLPFVTSVNKGS